jgi:hypothetical protein
MLRPVLVICAVLSLSPASAQQPETQLLEIPRQLWGQYNADVQACGTGLNHSPLRISWDRMQFYESSAKLEGLLRLRDGSIIVIAKREGEGQTWQSVYRLNYDEPTGALIVTMPQNSEMSQSDFVRFRCPAR